MRARPRRRAFVVASCAIVAAIGLAIAEVVLRLVNYPPHVIACGWRASALFSSTNELGFRGRKIVYAPSDRVVVLLGDSQVENAALSDDATPEARLEHHLGAERVRARVVSLGAAGYGQDQELLALEEYFARFRADLVVLWLTPQNDVWNNVFPTHWPHDGTPKPTFWLERGELCGPNYALGEVMTPPTELLRTVWWAWQRWAPLDERWARWLPAAYAPLASAGGPIDRSWQEEYDRGGPQMRLEELPTEKTHYALRLDPRSARTSYGIELTRQLIARIEQLATSRGAKFIMLVSEEATGFPPVEDRVYTLIGRLYRTSRTTYSENLAELERGFPCHVVVAPPSGWRQADWHLGALGTDEVMGSIARKVAASLAR